MLFKGNNRPMAAFFSLLKWAFWNMWFWCFTRWVIYWRVISRKVGSWCLRRIISILMLVYLQVIKVVHYIIFLHYFRGSILIPPKLFGEVVWVVSSIAVLWGVLVHNHSRVVFLLVHIRDPGHLISTVLRHHHFDWADSLSLKVVFRFECLFFVLELSVLLLVLFYFCG